MREDRGALRFAPPCSILDYPCTFCEMHLLARGRIIGPFHSASTTIFAFSSKSPSTHAQFLRHRSRTSTHTKTSPDTQPVQPVPHTLPARTHPNIPAQTTISPHRPEKTPHSPSLTRTAPKITPHRPSFHLHRLSSTPHRPKFPRTDPSMLRTAHKNARTDRLITPACQNL